MSRIVSFITSRSRWALAAGAVGTAGLALSTTAALGGFTASITNTGDTASSGTLVMQEQVGGAGGTTCLSTYNGTSTSNTANTTNTNTNCGANKFGLTNAVPGVAQSTNVVITNTGNIPASALTMLAAGCTSTTVSGAAFTGTDTTANNASNNYCNKVDITVEDDTAGTGTTTARCVYGAVGTGTGQTSCAAPSNTYNLATFATAYNNATSIIPASTTVAAGGGARIYKITVVIDQTASTNADQGLSANQNITFTFGQ